MKVRVKENQTGYFGDVRRRSGDVFDMPDANVVPLDDNGKALVDAKGKVRVCAWVSPVNPADLEKLLAKLGHKVKVEAPAVEPAKKDEPKKDEKKDDGDEI